MKVKAPERTAEFYTALFNIVHFGFIVEPAQFDAALDTIQASDTPIVSGPGTRDQGRYVFIEAPDGYTVEIFECLLPPYE